MKQILQGFMSGIPFPTFLKQAILLKKRFIIPLSLLIFLIVDLLVVFALYQTRPLYLLDIGRPGDTTFVKDFNSAETNDHGDYRWTTAESAVILPLVGSPFKVEVVATVSRPTPVPVHFSLNWDNPAHTQSFDIGADQVALATLKEYSLEVNNRPPFSFENRQLSIKSDVFKPGQGDTRSLGILVQQIKIQAQPNRFGFVVPPPITWFSLTMLLLILQSCLGVMFTRYHLLTKDSRLLFYVASLLLPLAVALVFFFDTYFFLDNALFLSPYVILSGLTVLSVLLAGQRAFPWLAATLAGFTLANLYGFFNVSFVVVFALTLLGLCYLSNPRLQNTGLNWLLISTLAVLASWGILQDINFRTADAEAHHFYWLNELDFLLRQGEFYPRWATDFGFGHGSTVLNFYAPVSRYLGEIFVLAGLPAGTAYRGLLTLLSAVGGIGLYYAARQFMDKPGSVVVAAAYLYNPYRLVNIYQRGSIAESVAFSFLPFLLLAFSLLLKLNFSRRKAVLLGAGAYALVVCSHQLTGFFTIIFFAGPYILLNLGYLAWKEKPEGWFLAIHNLGRRVFWIGSSMTLGLGLSAFYLLPAFAESNNIWLSNNVRFKPEDTLIDLSNYARLGDWVAHIEKLKTAPIYLENLAWIGISHIVLAGLGLVISFIPLARKRGSLWVPVMAGLMVVLQLGMQLNFAGPFWQQVPFMHYIEFSWRLMIFVGLFAPLLIGFLFEKLSLLVSFILRTRTGQPRLALAVAGVAIPLVALLAWTGAGNIILHFGDPYLTGRYSQQDVYSQVGDIYYLPVQVKNLQQLDFQETLKNSTTPYIERDSRQAADPVTMQRLSPTHFQLTANLSQPGKLVVPIFYFAGWNLASNGQAIPISYTQPLGLITTQLPAGSQVLELKFEDTPIRTIGFMVSLIAGLIVLGIVGTGWWKHHKVADTTVAELTSEANLGPTKV